MGDTDSERDREHEYQQRNHDDAEPEQPGLHAQDPGPVQHQRRRYRITEPTLAFRRSLGGEQLPDRVSGKPEVDDAPNREGRARRGDQRGIRTERSPGRLGDGSSAGRARAHEATAYREQQADDDHHLPQGVCSGSGFVPSLGHHDRFLPSWWRSECSRLLRRKRCPRACNAAGKTFWLASASSADPSDPSTTLGASAGTRKGAARPSTLASVREYSWLRTGCGATALTAPVSRTSKSARW